MKIISFFYYHTITLSHHRSYRIVLNKKRNQSRDIKSSKKNIYAICRTSCHPQESFKLSNLYFFEFFRSSRQQNKLSIIGNDFYPEE